jgi:hypothetical protein
MLTCNGCLSKLAKSPYVYKSTCTLYSNSDVILTLNKDSTFLYDIAYHNKKITGTWNINKDTLSLYSKYFSKEYQKPLAPKYKISDFIDKDVYLISGKKLFVISTKGLKRECFLYRTKIKH